MGSKISWVMLAVVGALVLLVSLISANLAYRGDFPVGGVSIGEIASGRDAGARRPARCARDRGRVGRCLGRCCSWPWWSAPTAAVTSRAGGESWLSLLALGAVAGARVPLHRQPAGTGTPLILLVVGIVALLLDVKRLSGPR